MDRETATLIGGQQLVNVHSRDICLPPCSIHSPSDHHMVTWRQSYREDNGVMERQCEHGYYHPDPDDVGIALGYASAVHGCDGCCQQGPLPYGLE